MWRNPKSTAKIQQDEIARWTGVKEQCIRKCAAKSTESQTPGVIALGIGPDRAEAAIAGIKRGLINHLIIDDSLAETIREKLKNQSQ
ncbi:MAG: hypothetical protein KDB14_30080 [Planctomycetales bacterium]|nr:hypothetical protein [Planctomycetales bacterium]